MIMNMHEAEGGGGGTEKEEKEKEKAVLYRARQVVGRNFAHCLEIYELRA